MSVPKGQIRCKECGSMCALVEIDGTNRDVDACIAGLVASLNIEGFATVASCCGHGNRPGNIALADGRELIIAPDFDTARFIDRMFPVGAHGEPVER